MSKIVKDLLTIIFVPIGLVLGAIWKAYVLSVLWAWFVVSTFGVPVLSIPVAIGVIMIVRFVQGQPKKNENDVDEGLSAAFGKAFLTPLAVLGIGWIVKGFI